MALGDSAVSICNIGLLAIGAEPIVSFQDPSKAAIICANRYDRVRRSILRSAPWNCAKRQATLAATSIVPAFTYDFAYPVPPDFMRMYDLPENDEAVWEVMNQPGVGTAILTSEGAPLEVVYIWDLQDPTQFDPLLTDAIGYAIGAVCAKPIVNSTKLKMEMAQEVEGRLQIARTASSQENSPREWDEDVWLRRRL